MIQACDKSKWPEAHQELKKTIQDYWNEFSSELDAFETTDETERRALNAISPSTVAFDLENIGN